MLNLIPITKENQPTSHIKIGASKVGASTDVVVIRHNDRKAYFYVRTVDDKVVDNIGNKVRLSGNITELFGGIDRSEDFLVDTDAKLSDIYECESATLYSGATDESQLEEFLRDNNYLIHPIEELVQHGDDLVSFDVVETEPEGYSTLLVTDNTDIEFLDAGEYRKRKSEARSRSDEGPREAGTDDEVTLNIEPKKPTRSFESDVAGLEDVKRTTEMLLALFDTSTRDEIENRYGEQFTARGNSMLLYGPPGCGKTLVCEAIAHKAKFDTDIEEQYGEVKFLEVKGSDILSKYSGQAEKRVRAVFEQAHGIAQEGFAVLFFDEIETLIPDRSDDSLQRHERSLTNAFLQEMNEIEDNLLVVGATNMPFIIDPAATRRFPIQQFIPQPEERVMADVWRKHLASLPDTEDIDFERLAAKSVGYTPAEVADRVLGSELQRELVESVVRSDRQPIDVDTEYLLNRLEQIDPKTIRQYIASVRREVDELEGYPELRRYVEEQAERLGIGLRPNQSLVDLFRQSGGATTGDSDTDLGTAAVDGGRGGVVDDSNRETENADED